MMRIRQASIDELPVLLPLVQAYWNFEGIKGFDTHHVAAQLARLLSDPRLGAGWLAYADDEAAGYLLAVYVFSLEHLGLTAEIDEFFVLPRLRGRGIGQAMLKAAEAAFDGAGCTNVSLQVAAGNDTARAFYHRLGYQERSGFGILDKALPHSLA
jgi:GNAT superfamily N-acetyltransferase